MSMVVNNNLMAANIARNLNAHYGRLATSTQRLSSGLRVNSAADDAAGLAIRELQRADIAAMHQGARNANDAVSLIQVADGALGIIDEKLIRMKELAEQAATGTYDSTQRLMVESEYQAMASEITRIANATDFNNIKLLDGTLEGEHDGSDLDSDGSLKIHFGTGNDSAEDYYYIHIGECTAKAFGLGSDSTWEDVHGRATAAFRAELESQIKNSWLSDSQKRDLMTQVDNSVAQYDAALSSAIDPVNVYTLLTDEKDTAFLDAVKDNWKSNSSILDRLLSASAEAAENFASTTRDYAYNLLIEAAGSVPEPPDVDGQILIESALQYYNNVVENMMTIAKRIGFNDSAVGELAANLAKCWPPNALDLNKHDEYGFQFWKSSFINFKGLDMDNADEIEAAAKSFAAATVMNGFWDGLRPNDQQKLKYALGQAAVNLLANSDAPTYNMNLDAFDFGGGIAGADKLLNKALSAVHAKIGKMDFAGYTIETQEDAQHALEAINNAIVQKDKIRAHLGAAQNRLENTISNLNIQAENLQAAESRISDVDVATEMTEFVRNQILTQSAVAMLSQANSLPQMAMQIIGA